MSDLKQKNELYESEFPQRWPELLESFRSPGPDGFFLIRHASYLFRTANIRWALDPLLKSPEPMRSAEKRIARDMDCLSFVLISHFHIDHFDPSFCALMKGSRVPWLIPDFAPEEIRSALESACLPVRYISAGDTLDIDGIHIRVFNGHHNDESRKINQVESLSFEIQVNGRRLYFPGDVRDYRVSQIRDCLRPDALFAHLWLGRSRALEAYPEDMLLPYCRYLSSYDAHTYYITHLYNEPREPEEIWTDRHAELVIRELTRIRPRAEFRVPALGEFVIL